MPQLPTQDLAWVVKRVARRVNALSSQVNDTWLMVLIDQNRVVTVPLQKGPGL